MRTLKLIKQTSKFVGLTMLLMMAGICSGEFSEILTWLGVSAVLLWFGGAFKK